MDLTLFTQIEAEGGEDKLTWSSQCSHGIIYLWLSYPLKPCLQTTEASSHLWCHYPRILSASPRDLDCCTIMDKC